jgi:molecular chaperone HscB
MTDPFDTLGISPAIHLDLGAVEKRYRELLRVLHPDRHVAGSPADRRLSIGKATSVNEAWRVLRDPIRRSEAFFRRQGVTIKEGTEPPAKPEFLMEMMEQREELAEARTKRDAAGIARLGERMRSRQAQVLDQLAAAFERNARQPDLLAKSVPLLGELRYYRRFLDEVSTIEDESL